MEDPRQYIVRTSGDGLTRGVFRGLSMTHPNRLDMTEWPGKISDEQWMSDNTYAMHSPPPFHPNRRSCAGSSVTHHASPFRGSSDNYAIWARVRSFVSLYAVFGL